MTLTAAQRDRACGALLGAAAGDALGAGYEFGPPLAPDAPVDMIGGGLGPFKPGEWTDDTSMAIAIAEIAATGADLRDEAALDYIADRWHWWARNAKDIGVQTRSVLSAAARRGISARTAREEAAALHGRTGRTAGNGSLMRTAPVALAYLDDEAALAEAARAVSELTHHDSDAGDACVLWCTAIRHAILNGHLDVRIGLGHLDFDRRDLWASRLDEAETLHPSDFAAKNGWVVAALQGAWSSIVNTPVPIDDPASEVFRADHLRLALEAAVRGGGDTDTVAAIAGGLLGAVYGASAVPVALAVGVAGLARSDHPRSGPTGDPDRPQGPARYFRLHLRRPPRGAQTRPASLRRQGVDRWYRRPAEVAQGSGRDRVAVPGERRAPARGCETARCPPYRSGGSERPSRFRAARRRAGNRAIAGRGSDGVRPLRSGLQSHADHRRVVRSPQTRHRH